MQTNNQQSKTENKDTELEYNLQQYDNMQSIKLIRKHLDEAWLMLHSYRRGLYDLKQEDEVWNIFKKIETHVEMASLIQIVLARSLPDKSPLIAKLVKEISRTHETTFNLRLHYKKHCEMSVKQKAGASFKFSKL